MSVAGQTFFLGLNFADGGSRVSFGFLARDHAQLLPERRFVLVAAEGAGGLLEPLQLCRTIRAGLLAPTIHAMAPPVGYVAYIDEAGDTGLKNVKRPGKPGASEWFAVSAIVVRVEREHEVTGWTRKMISNLDQHQVRHLHFRELPEHKKPAVCRSLASREARIFVLLSNKRNMENYRNLHAERARVNKTAWFYVWCTKVLLESVTDYCGRRSRREFGSPRTVRFEFSQCGGVKLDDVRNYYQYIKDKARLGLLFSKEFPLDWDVVDPNEMHIYPNDARAGLQLSDVAASAFYSAVERDNGGGTKPDFAKLLLPRICPDVKGRRYMYGLKVLPRHLPPRLPPEQKDIFDFYMPR